MDHRDLQTRKADPDERRRHSRSSVACGSYTTCGRPRIRPWEPSIAGLFPRTRGAQPTPFQNSSRGEDGDVARDRRLVQLAPSSPFLGISFTNQPRKETTRTTSCLNEGTYPSTETGQVQPRVRGTLANCRIVSRAVAPTSPENAETSQGSERSPPRFEPAVLTLLATTRRSCSKLAVTHCRLRCTLSRFAMERC
jgi:hypothetical protein